MFTLYFIIVCILCKIHIHSCSNDRCWIPYESVGQFSPQSTKKKNISYDNFGTKLGNIHMERQDFAKLQTRKRKALKKVSNDTGVPPVSKKKKD